LFYRGSVLANLLPVEEATKAGSLSTLPSLKRSLGPSELLFSNHLGIKLPARTTTQLVSLASITSECLITRKNAKEKKRSKRKSSNEHYCWGPSASEGPQKQDLTVFLEYNMCTGILGQVGIAVDRNNMKVDTEPKV
jgi:hypothetical protein